MEANGRMPSKEGHHVRISIGRSVRCGGMDSAASETMMGCSGRNMEGESLAARGHNLRGCLCQKRVEIHLTVRAFTRRIRAWKPGNATRWRRRKTSKLATRVRFPPPAIGHN